MVFIHIEKDDVRHVHRIEELKTLKTVISDVVTEFGEPLDIAERDGVTRMTYGAVDGCGDEWLVFVNEVKRSRW